MHSITALRTRVTLEIAFQLVYFLKKTTLFSVPAKWKKFSTGISTYHLYLEIRMHTHTFIEILFLNNIESVHF